MVYQNVVDPMDPSAEAPGLFVAAFRDAAQRLRWVEIIAAFGTAFEFEFDPWTRASMDIRPPSRIPAALGVGQSPLAPAGIFGSTDLVETIEVANAEFLAQSVRAAAAPAAFVHPVAGGVATYVGPDSPFNKVAGLGFQGVPDVDSLERLEAPIYPKKARADRSASTGWSSIGSPWPTMIRSMGSSRMRSMLARAAALSEKPLARSMPLSATFP